MLFRRVQLLVVGMFADVTSSEGDELIRLHRDYVVPGYSSYKIYRPETKKLVQ